MSPNIIAFFKFGFLFLYIRTTPAAQHTSGLSVCQLTEELLVQFSWNLVEGWHMDHEGIHSILEWVQITWHRCTNYFQNEWDLVAGLSVLPDSRGQRWLSEPDGERGVFSQKYFYVIENHLFKSFNGISWATTVWSYTSVYISLKSHQLSLSRAVGIITGPWQGPPDLNRPPATPFNQYSHFVFVLRSAVSFTHHHLCVLRPQQGVVWWQGWLWLYMLCWGDLCLNLCVD